MWIMWGASSYKSGVWTVLDVEFCIIRKYLHDIFTVNVRANILIQEIKYNSYSGLY